MNLQICPATTAHIHEIIEIARATWPVAYDGILKADQLAYMLDTFYASDTLSDQMQQQGYSFIIARRANGEPIGFAAYAPHDDDSSTYHLHKLYVLPAAQGRKAGKTLLEFVINAAIKKGAKNLQLNVNQHNLARKFYAKEGFHVIREEDIDIGCGYFMNDYVMEKKLV